MTFVVVSFLLSNVGFVKFLHTTKSLLIPFNIQKSHQFLQTTLDQTTDKGINVKYEDILSMSYPSNAKTFPSLN